MEYNKVQEVSLLETRDGFFFPDFSCPPQPQNSRRYSFLWAVTTELDLCWFLLVFGETFVQLLSVSFKLKHILVDFLFIEETLGFCSGKRYNKYFIGR